MKDSCCLVSKSMAHAGGAIRTRENRQPRKTEVAELFLESGGFDGIEDIVFGAGAALIGGYCDGTARKR